MSAVVDIGEMRFIRGICLNYGCEGYTSGLFYKGVCQNCGAEMEIYNDSAQARTTSDR
jgi:hypothetical protein